ncbi:MAG: ComF family protein [Erysipelotrichaceae bacterium]
MKHESCLVCMQELDEGMDIIGWLKGDDNICGYCRKLFDQIDYHTKLDTYPLHILYTYKDDIENLIYCFKENRDIALAPIFFKQYTQYINRHYKGFTIVIMPSNQEKTQMRTFHAMLEMLKEVNLTIIDPFYKTKVHKQSLQSFKDRLKIQEIMKMKENIILPNTPLLLIDDVLTTASTIKWAFHLLSDHPYPIEGLVLSAHPLFLEKAKRVKVSKCENKLKKARKILQLLLKMKMTIIETIRKEMDIICKEK